MQASEPQKTELPLPSLQGMSLHEMTELVRSGGFEAWRARQLYHWVYKKGADSFDAMKNLPARMRAHLAERARICPLELQRVTGASGATNKALFRLHDGRLIESVTMRDPETGRTSFCVSSQVGCALACSFCLTGFGGWQRNLTAGEIIGQALTMRARMLSPDETLDNMVFMGMGEPMLNLEAVEPALRLLTDPEGFGLSRRRITVSTAGVVPGIETLGRAEPKVNLAISLNATTDETRSLIMPINKRWPIAELLRAVAEYPLEARRRVTIEYVLLKGVNDTLDDARRLVELMRSLRCKVNLIMFNTCPELPYEPVAPETLDAFAGILSKANLTVTVRWSKGREIEAACGQLAAHSLERAHA